ncbi:MAG TPA: hypothetical protein VGY56_10895 [Verrucomicrobiae bacterium]|nr:hypothetical protein [Verrucomicrobiae bacterium]
MNQIIEAKTENNTVKKQWPECVGIEDAAMMFGWPDFYLPFLMKAGHLKPLGRPSQNGRKWLLWLTAYHSSGAIRGRSATTAGHVHPRVDQLLASLVSFG